MGFLFSASRQRLFGLLPFFILNFSFIFNLFNFLARFFNGLHRCCDVLGVRTRGVTCASLACIPLTHSVPWHCKCFLSPILAYVKGAFCAPAHSALCTFVTGLWHKRVALQVGDTITVFLRA